MHGEIQIRPEEVVKVQVLARGREASIQHRVNTTHSSHIGGIEFCVPNKIPLGNVVCDTRYNCVRKNIRTET